MISHVVSVIVVSAFAMGALALYLLPVLVAWARHMPGTAVIAVINVFLGWTFFGWVLALALALRPVYPAGPVVQVFQNAPPQPPALPPGGMAGAGWAGPPGPPSPRPDPAPPLTLSSRSAANQETSHGR